MTTLIGASGLIARFDSEAHCVRCGKVLRESTVFRCLDQSLVPCCAECKKFVRIDIAEGHPVWPPDWSGQWWKDVTGNEWDHEYREYGDGIALAQLLSTR